MSKKSVLTGVLAALLLAAFAPVQAADEAAKINKALETLLPGKKPDSVTASAIPGVYEVSYGATVLYMTQDGRYLIRGDVIDVAQEENLTELKRSQARLKVINGISESSMIVFAPKQVKHTITVFTDIDCGYCRKMHGEMAQLNKYGIKVRYLAYPRTGIDSPSYVKAVSAWCAKDRNAALTHAKADEDVPQKTCAHPVQQHMQAVKQVGVSGTPTLILEDGSLIPGYVPAERLMEMLDGRKAS
ncbi:MAG: thioredoxin fold domain-containing protein [Proteobacteria bacterium]|nr:thioredoxin fold domain-containing protein [Pseudomonadota bacterium]